MNRLQMTLNSLFSRQQALANGTLEVFPIFFKNFFVKLIAFFLENKGITSQIRWRYGRDSRHFGLVNPWASEPNGQRLGSSRRQRVEAFSRSSTVMCYAAANQLVKWWPRPILSGNFEALAGWSSTISFVVRLSLLLSFFFFNQLAYIRSQLWFG